MSAVDWPLAAAIGMSVVAIGLPGLAPLAPQSAPSWTTRWYLPALMPSNQPIEPTSTSSPSVCENVTVVPLIFEPLIGLRSRWAWNALGGGGGAGSGAGSAASACLVSGASLLPALSGESASGSLGSLGVVSAFLP